MARIWSMMDVGKRSLMNSQTALQTVAHNVANKSTEGYSRQRVDTVSNAPMAEGQLQVGMGARASRITRVNNEFLEKQIEREGNQLGYLNSRTDLLTRVEQVYNEQANEGLNHSVGRFFNSFRELGCKRKMFGHKPHAFKGNAVTHRMKHVDAVCFDAMREGVHAGRCCHRRRQSHRELRAQENPLC